MPVFTGNIGGCTRFACTKGRAARKHPGPTITGQKMRSTARFIAQVCGGLSRRMIRYSLMEQYPCQYTHEFPTHPLLHRLR